MRATNLLFVLCLSPTLFAPLAVAKDRTACDQPAATGTQTQAFEERKKCFSNQIKSDAKPDRKAVKGERVMQPEYGADASAHEAAHTVQQKGDKPEPAAADMYLKIGDIKGETAD